MAQKKIIDLGQYRKKKIEHDKNGKSSRDGCLSIEDKLQKLIHRPFNDPGSKNELLTIFEEEWMKKEMDDEKE